MAKTPPIDPQNYALLHMLQWHDLCANSIAIDKFPRQWYQTPQRTRPLSTFIASHSRSENVESAHLPPLNLSKENLSNQSKQIQPTDDPLKHGTLAILARAQKIVAEISNYEALIDAIEKFSCPLKDTANHTLTHDGNFTSKIMFLGDAPRTEDEVEAVVFAGMQGELINKMLSYIGISRQNDCLMSNLVYWRPPGNRTLTQGEVEICRPFFEKMIALCAPDLIVTLGKTASCALLQNSEHTLSQLRGKKHLYQNRFMENPCKLKVSFHPSYLLIAIEKKQQAWHDMLTIKKILES